MKDLLVLLAHLLTTIAKLLGTGSAKAIVADSLFMKQQLLVLNRGRRRAPNLTALDHFLLGFWSLFLNPRHFQRAAVIIKPSTLLKLHRVFKEQKYRRLYSSGRKIKPGSNDATHGSAAHGLPSKSIKHSAPILIKMLSDVSSQPITGQLRLMDHRG
jgi:hypothetical protein